MKKNTSKKIFSTFRGNNSCIISNKVKNEETGVDKAKSLFIVEIIEYISNSIVSKTILKKTTGNISALSFDTSKGLSKKISAFDTFVQIIDGTAEIIIGGKPMMLETGQSIIIPAHTSNCIKANEQFKMIMTIIKSGYE